RHGKRGLSMEILCDVLEKHSKPREALKIATALIEDGVHDAITTLYFILSRNEERSGLDSSIFTKKHVELLIATFRYPRVGRWALGSLKVNCDLRPDLCSFVKGLEGAAKMTVKVSLRYCTSEANSDSIWRALSELVEAPLKILRNEPLHLLEHIHLNWTGREDLLIALLKKRFYPLARAILEDFVGSAFRERHLNVEIGPVSWWLDWIKNTRGQNRFWLANRLGYFFSAASKET